tara:strand:+ start:2589 stop:2987 length:399 start_codon:yes stop_codon:yes gene_type:complete
MATLEELKASFSKNIDVLLKENNQNVLKSFSSAIEIYLSVDRSGKLVLRTMAAGYDALCLAEDAVNHEVDVESMLYKRTVLTDIVERACRIYEPDCPETYEAEREEAKERAERLSTALEEAATLIRERAAQI